MSNIISIKSNWPNNRNEERHEAYYRNEQSRLFQSNKAMHMMTRVISGKTSNMKRPTTAVITGPTLTQAHGLMRQRLASNSILNYNSKDRSSKRRFQYNKNNY